MPACRTHPMKTRSTSDFAIPSREMAPSMAAAPSFDAFTVDSAPWNAPVGVLAAAERTMFIFCLLRKYTSASAPFLAATRHTEKTHSSRYNLPYTDVYVQSIQAAAGQLSVASVYTFPADRKVAVRASRAWSPSGWPDSSLPARERSSHR